MDPTSTGGAGSEGLGDMSPEEFRLHAHRLVEWMADYLRDVESYPVLSRSQPGDLQSALPSSAPEVGEPFDALFDDFQASVLPGVTHWNHPGFMAYFANTASGPGILGEMLTAVLNVNAMVWRSSPAATELEIHVLDWIRQMLDLPAGFDGTINDTASHSTLYALAAARESAYTGYRESGLAGLSPGRIYTSEEAHSSVEKAVMTLGFGRAGVRTIGTDTTLALRPELLEAALREDRAAGVQPVAVVATVGTTSTTAVDPVAEIADLCEQHGVWLHVDAAYAGAVAMVPSFRHHFRGWERADSIVFNPHKWLFTPVDCSILYCRRPALLEQAFSLTPEYLTSRGHGETRNLMDSGVALGRRFRALKLWFVVRYFGVEGIRLRIAEHVRLAQRVAGRVEAEPHWELVAPVPFSTAVFRWTPPGVAAEEQDRLNLAILDRVNSGGEVFLTHTRVHGRIAIRLAVGNLRTGEEHVDHTWELLTGAAARAGGPEAAG